MCLCLYLYQNRPARREGRSEARRVKQGGSRAAGGAGARSERAHGPMRHERRTHQQRDSPYARVRLLHAQCAAISSIFIRILSHSLIHLYFSVIN